jgi:hypothetical protein
MRDYLYEHTTLVHLENLHKPGFYDTSQDTMLLILQLRQGPRDFFFPYKHMYLSPYVKELQALVQGTTTLAELGLGVKTGNVVWNQHKEALADEGTLLLYSSNLHKGQLVFPPLKAPKKQYIRLDKPLLEGPNLLVERGYGNGYQFHYALIDQPCYAENHLNVISANGPLPTGLAEAICVSLESEETKKFLKMFVGNGALSASELLHVFPLWIN